MTLYERSSYDKLHGHTYLKSVEPYVFEVFHIGCGGRISRVIAVRSIISADMKSQPKPVAILYCEKCQGMPKHLHDAEPLKEGNVIEV